MMALAEGDPAARANHRLVDAAPHHRGGAHAVRQPRQIDLLHHLLQAAIGVADQIGHRALQQDLARGHRAGAELVLEARDAVGVAAAVLEPARQGEQGQPAGAGRSTLGARQQQRDVGVGVRAEPFVAIEPPHTVLAARHRFDRADVGAAGPFGHELRALPLHGRVGRQHFRQQIFLQLVAGEFADQMDRGVGDADRAHQPELGLHEQILQRVFGDRGQRPVHAERAAAMAHGMKLEIGEGDALHLAIGRMVVDPVLVAAEPIPGIEHRRMLVGDPGEFIEPPARQFAEPIEMRFQPPKILRLQIKPEQIAQAAIDRIEILSRAVRRDVKRTAALGAGFDERLVWGRRVHV